ncbi:hypothetical protein [Listeria aquatica]|uniref:Uncharacterized protein n=1 Tax=Listeria aquatica FSL S10-1188 TaxID=1265818 RepID=W7ASG5_9LIST|nr:hypothetical protein [Listeria aquatica]EUJ16557.1 hypothetical protein MAQA_15911 [Listeria aquatica FSL S10-1188]
MTLSAYMTSLLEKNMFTYEIEQRENKFYQVIEDLEIILSRQTEVMEKFHEDVQILMTSNIEERGITHGK